MIDKRTRIKIAIQKSGRLTDHSLDLLERCGLKYTRGRDQLIGYGENMPVDLLFVRDDDIPGLVRDDVCDLGIAGLNVIEEKRLEFVTEGISDPYIEVCRLDYGHCRLAFGYPETGSIQAIRSLEGSTIATSYPFILRDFLKQQNIAADVIEFSGAVEIAPSLGRADVICDLVSTGTTMAANKIREGETILESECILLKTPVAISPEKTEWVDRLLQRIEGVMQVRESKYIMMHAPKVALPDITALLPGAESPTVLPLEGFADKVAIHVVCRENIFWETLEALKDVGASSILVLPVEKMLA
ncbi:MAG: ATP phosphoribosyltransferase [Chromatiales bacterium]|jgi:ATP phosphoribosyltransferase|nr:ATP phosphoribosyltransferase [Chromatiales bacterium]